MPTFQQFPLPDAGEGLTEAEIVAWHVAVGDTVEVNQTIVEIETAKSLVDLPSPWSGVVTRLLVEPGQTVDVGTPIIEVDTDPHGSATSAGACCVRAPAGRTRTGTGSTRRTPWWSTAWCCWRRTRGGTGSSTPPASR